MQQRRRNNRSDIRQNMAKRFIEPPPPLSGLLLLPVLPPSELLTVMVTESLEVPPAPVQLRLKVLVAVSCEMTALPLVFLSPDQLPDAVQEVALLEFQLSVVDPFIFTLMGEAFSETEIEGGDVSPPEVTATVTDRVDVPPLPVQLRA